MVLFDRCGNNARDTDAIAPHDHGLAAALLVKYGGIHGFRVLGAELENMAHFDTPANLQRAFSARARVAAHNLPDIGKFGVWHIARPGCAFDVVTVLVGAADKAWHRGGGMVDNHSDGYAHRPKRAEAGTEASFDLIRLSEDEGRRHTRQFTCLDRIEAMITPDDQCHQLARSVLCQQRFNRFISRNIQLLRERFDGGEARRCKLFEHGHVIALNCARRRDRRCQLDVGSVITAR